MYVILSLILLVFVIGMMFIISKKYLGQGCNGDCNQGRLPCNCKGEE